MLVFTFNSLAEGKYSKFFFVAAFPVKNSHLLIIPDDKAQKLSSLSI